MKINKKNENIKINKRLFLFASFKLISVTFILERLYNLQIRKSDKYQKLAENNRIHHMFILPPRGLIYDRYDNLLAENKEQYQLIYRLEDSSNHLNYIQKVFKYVDLDQNKKFEILTKLKNRMNQDFVQMIIKNNLTWKEVAKVSSNITELRGIFIEMILVRNYKSIPSSHVVGYVVKPEITVNPKLSKVPGTVVGKIGIEKSFDSNLQGKFGIKKEEVNAHGRVVKELSRVNGIAGKDINLSISKNLQEFCYERLKENSGSIVTVDLDSGEILALVSKPSFNSNDFVNDLSKQKWKIISENKLKPMFNRACMGTYPPGSIFKLIVGISALEDKEFNPDKKYFCSGGFQFGNQVFHCWKKEGHGHINLEEAIAMSCDCYFYNLSLDIGIDKISETALSFGLGEKYLNEIFSSSFGIVPNKKWKKERFNNSWTKSDTIVASIGQGYSLATPLQLAIMAGRIATDGKLIMPTIIKKKFKTKDFPKINTINKNVYSLIKRGMFNTVNQINGTAYGSRLLNSKFLMAGKTATSQVRRITMEEREEGIKKNEELPRDQRDHALFVGYFPHLNPKFAFSIVVEHGGSGSKAAAPIARDLCKNLTDYL